MLNASIRLDYVWLLNNDIVVHPAALRALCVEAAVDPSVGVWGCTLCADEAFAVVESIGATYSTWTTHRRSVLSGTSVTALTRVLERPRVDFIIGASMFMPYDAYRACGGMPTEYFMYYEELDIVARLRSVGRGVGWCRDALVAHGGGLATGVSGLDRCKAPAVAYHSMRSAVIYTRKHAPYALPSVLFSRLLRNVCYEGLAGNPAAACAAARGCFGGLTSPILGSRSMIAVILFLLPAAGVLLLCRGRLEVGLLASVGLGQWLAGAYVTRSWNHGLFAVVAAGATAYLVGYVAAGGQRRHRSAADGAHVSADVRVVLGGLSVATIVLVVVHFAVGGIPLFSPDVETARFQIANSGFFGLPSRAYLFGLPILLLAYSSLRDLSRRDRAILVTLVVTFVVSRLLGGLKSGLWEVTLVALLAHVVHVGSAPPVLSRPVVRRALLAVVAIAFAAYLGTQYATVHVRSTRGAADYLAARLTVGTVGAGIYAVEGHALDRDGSRVLADFLYYADRYSAGLPQKMGLFAPPAFDTSRLISTGSQSMAPDTTAYVSPVAPGLAPSLFLDWRWPGVLLGMAAAGYVMRRLQWRALAVSGLQAGSWATAALVAVYVVTNGSLAYYSINFVVVAALYLIAQAVLLGALRPRSRPGAPAGAEATDTDTDLGGVEVT